MKSLARSTLALVLASLISSCGGDSGVNLGGGGSGGSGGGEPPPAVGKGSSNPARMGVPVTMETSGPFTGTAQIRLTLREMILGAEAEAIVLGSSPDNDPAPTGHHYLLIRFHVEILNTSTPDQVVEITRSEWHAARANFFYPQSDACCLSSPLERGGMVGDDWDGWLPFVIELGDPGLFVFQRGGSDPTWFTPQQ